MADIPAGAFTPKDWEALNQQFWKSWSAGVPNAATPAPGKLPWHEGLEQWSRLFAGSGEQGEVVERMLAGARQFATFAQSAAQGAGATPWNIAAMQPPGGASAFANPMLDAMRSISGSGAKGFEELAAQTQRMIEPLKQEMAGLMSMPAFGSQREQQERTQKLGAAMTGYQEWFGRYQALMLQASKRAYELMESKLAERSEPGREISTLRGVYDVWIDAAEEGYAEVALSPEFRKVYGELVNAQMRLRKHVNEETERSTQSLGMPTRTEVNSVHARLVEVRRRIARIEEALGISDDTGDATDDDASASPVTAARAPKRRAVSPRAHQSDARAGAGEPRRATARVTKSQGSNRPASKPQAAKRASPGPRPVAARAPAFAEQLAAARASKRGSAAKKKRK